MKDRIEAMTRRVQREYDRAERFLARQVRAREVRDRMQDRSVCVVLGSELHRTVQGLTMSWFEQQRERERHEQERRDREYREYERQQREQREEMRRAHDARERREEREHRERYRRYQEWQNHQDQARD